MKDNLEIKQTVKDKYNALAIDSESCCEPGCGTTFVGESYLEIDGYVQDADLGLGCGLPTAAAGINPGFTVVDLGSGAGNDCFIARSLVGERGCVIGIDMAEEMYKKAVANAAKLGYTNVEFRLGEIEDVPIADETADVVVSNCVFNLVPDKSKAFSETYRILKPGAHFSISDIVIRGDMPEALRQAAELYVGCVSGAIDLAAYIEIIKAAGFEDIRIVKQREIELTDELLDQYLDDSGKAQFKAAGIGVLSITVNATKPDDACCGGECC